MSDNIKDTPFIQISHIRKIYKMGSEKIVALDDVSLNINRGEFVCFLGKSGSGKSTFLNMVAGLEKPTKGEIIIGGIHIEKLTEEQITIFRQKNIGFIFQSYQLIPSLNALENVALPLVFRGVPVKNAQNAAKKCLDDVGLKGYYMRRPSQMSGGQQQRVGIARALVNKAKIIFADEPTGNLDSNTTLDVMKLIVGISKKNNQTIILVTHDNSIADYADKIVEIKDGNIINVVQKEKKNEVEN